MYYTVLNLNIVIILKDIEIYQYKLGDLVVLTNNLDCYCATNKTVNSYAYFENVGCFLCQCTICIPFRLFNFCDKMVSNEPRSMHVDKAGLL